MAEGSSRPQIMFKATYSNGQSVMVDDYREAYWWLRDKTPEDKTRLTRTIIITMTLTLNPNPNPRTRA